MYFSKFVSFQSAAENSQSCSIAVERINGEVIVGSPVPRESLPDLLNELEDVDAGHPIHVWMGPKKELVTIPFSQIASVRLVFQ